MPSLLVIHHAPTSATRSLLEAVLAGANDPAIQGINVRAVPALEATADDVSAADGYILGTPANFGNLATKQNPVAVWRKPISVRNPAPPGLRD